MYSGVTTIELDNLAAETAASMTTKHPDYQILAARIAISNLHKETKKAFSGKLLEIFFIMVEFFLKVIYYRCEKKDVCEDLYNARNHKTNAWEPLISKELYDVVKANADVRFLSKKSNQKL